jgi:hypothetical protein
VSPLNPLSVSPWPIPGVVSTYGVDCPGRNPPFGLLSALRAHTEAPYRTDLLWETRRALNRPGRARTDLR